MKHLIYIIILLGVVNSASGQTLDPASFSDTGKAGQYAAVVNGVSGWYSASDTTTDTVMLKIILSNKTSVHFYRKGLKRGEQYWYFDRNRIKKLPANWFVWETRPIKQ